MHPIETTFATTPTVQRLEVHPNFDPTTIAQLSAFQAFLGRPALYYAHENLFAGGAAAFDQQVAAINAYVPGLRWGALDAVLLRAYLWRRESDGTISVRMGGGAIHLGNPDHSPRTFRISKPEDGTVPVRAVTVDGAPAAYSLAGGELGLEIVLDGDGSADIEVRYGNGTVDLFPALAESGAQNRIPAYRVDLCNGGDSAAAGILGISRTPSASLVLSRPVFLPAHSCAPVIRQRPRSTGMRLVADPYDEVVETDERDNDLGPW
jgi:hypothetical protein